MRLLELKSNGGVSLTKDLVVNIPPYAILSHTWGDDDDEVTFKDLMEGSGKTKRGYEKIRFCATQASNDGLQYIWIDTCCIDKSNNVELSEAIISMFRWYRNATKCYVYLMDVSSIGQDPIAQPPTPAFWKSRWFTRGWTLQELIAPSSVEFFSAEGQFLGSKNTLEHQVHKITGIAVKALHGHALSEFSVEERLSWAEFRETKRGEDKAYSLLGMFNVNMSPLYGEGVESAFGRLHEEIDKRLKSTHDSNLLDRLPYAAEAPSNAYQRQYEPICLPDTRTGLLEDVYKWANEQGTPCMFWLSGMAGTGKSTISRTVATRYLHKGSLGASFFFSRGGGDIGNAGKFVTTIAVQLANNIPALKRSICEAISQHSSIAAQSLRDQWRHLVLGPLSQLKVNKCCPSYIIVVDALDECDDENDIRTLLQLLSEACSIKTIQLQVFLTTRPEIPIRHGFTQVPEAKHQTFVLHDISPSTVDHDIRILLQHELKDIASKRSLGENWPSEQVVNGLVHNASGLFIWAATACRFIREGKKTQAIRRRLSDLLRGDGCIIKPEKHLDEIYTTVLQHSLPAELSQEEKEPIYHMLRRVLGTIVVLFSPLSASSLSKILFITDEEVEETLEDLHSILNISQDRTYPLRLHHPSFRDFLLNKERCNDSNFRVNYKQAHQLLAFHCILLMSTSLKQDICGVGVPGMLVSDVERSWVECNLRAEVQYACLYWTQHIEKSGDQLCDNGQMHCFLQEHFLHWLEALGWMGKVSEGVNAIVSLELFAASSDCPSLSSFIHDAKRFILYNRSIIEQAPLQLYSAALVFAPKNSIIRKQFLTQLPLWICLLPEVQDDWNSSLQTLEGHSSSVIAVAFSPDSQILASASFDNTVRLWDSKTGGSRTTLEGHTCGVSTVAFSPDGHLLASASFDNTVRLWDSATGVSQGTLNGHLSSVIAVAFSPDSQLLASASYDKTVRLWNPKTRALRGTLKGHTGSVTAIAFSPDSELLASASSDNTVRLWDSKTGGLRGTLEGYTGGLGAVIFSSDGQLLAFASSDRTVRLWDLKARVLCGTLEHHSDSVYAIAFSPDGQLLASASRDIVRLWDSNTRKLRGTLKGEFGTMAVAFSPDGQLLASVSDDNTVTLWDSKTGVWHRTLKGYSRQRPNPYATIAFSPDGQLLASPSYDNTVTLWDSKIRGSCGTPKGHSDSVDAMAFSPDGQLLATASRNIVRLWNSKIGGLRGNLEGHSGKVLTVEFSPDSRLLASTSYDNTIRLWDSTIGASRGTLEGHLNLVTAVAFSLDGQLLASASYDKTVRLWDPKTRALRGILTGHSREVATVTFSPDSQLLASTSFDRTVRLWDSKTGTLCGIIEGHTSRVGAVAFSPNSQLLASASLDTVIRLWDPKTGESRGTLEGHSKWIEAMAFSPDSRLLASASYDNTVMLWDMQTKEAVQIFNTGKLISALSFSSDGSCLETNRGLLELSCLYRSVGQPQPDLSSYLYVEEQWVTCRTEKFLWLPMDYRPRCLYVRGNTLVLRHVQGKVTFIEIDLNKIPLRVAIA